MLIYMYVCFVVLLVTMADGIKIGLALRLAIALGCDKPANRQSCLPSQAAHRVRLWWTVYMLDRYVSLQVLPSID